MHSCGSLRVRVPPGRRPRELPWQQRCASACCCSCLCSRRRRCSPSQWRTCSQQRRGRRLPSARRLPTRPATPTTLSSGPPSTTATRASWTSGRGRATARWWLGRATVQRPVGRRCGAATHRAPSTRTAAASSRATASARWTLSSAVFWPNVARQTRHRPQRHRHPQLRTRPPREASRCSRAARMTTTPTGFRRWSPTLRTARGC